MTDRVIISICGPSGSGKSILAKELVKKIGKDISVRLPGDDFLKSSVYKDYEQFISTPFQYDWKLIDTLIKYPLGRDIQVPEFDFVKFKRNVNGEGKKITLQRYIIIDSILPYPKSDIVINITGSKNVRQKRLKERDKRWNASVISNWKKLELTYALIEKSHKFINLELDGDEEIHENIESAIAYLYKRKVMS